MTADRPSAADCAICGAESLPDEAVVLRDERWAAEVLDGYEVPGWIVLRARRHAERITGLDDVELQELGVRARDVVAAVSDVMGAPATYLMVFGENYPHFHVLVAARGDDVPAENRGGAIVGLREARRDRAAALALVPALRDALPTA